jgi:hypothetical protein
VPLAGVVESNREAATGNPLDFPQAAWRYTLADVFIPVHIGACCWRPRPKRLGACSAQGALV